MQVTKEDRIFKSLALLCVFFGLILNFTEFVAPEYKLFIVLPMVVALSILAFRKYLRDKREGKPLRPYYILLGFVLISVLMALVAAFMITA